MELIAKFKKQLEIVERSNFKSRKVWVVTEDNPQYPQTVELETSGDKCGLFDNIAEGAPVKVYVNLRGREWTGTDNVTKVFNTLQAWKVEALPGAEKATPVKAAEPDEISDLPF